MYFFVVFFYLCIIFSNFLAAHCFYSKSTTEAVLSREIKVIFGAHDLQNLTESKRYELNPKNILIHEKWNPRTRDYDADLALLEFEANSITFNEFVKPICLWDKGREPKVTEGEVAGWGVNEYAAQGFQNIPKMVELKIQSNEECLPGAEELTKLSSLQTFCAGQKNGSGVCAGDSGSGLVSKVGGRYFLKGIVSVGLLDGVGMCRVMDNAIYTNVPKFRDWIVENSRRNEIALSKIRVRSAACTLTKSNSICCGQVNACVVNQAIEDEDIEVKVQSDTIFEAFENSDNARVKFLPRRIGEKLPSLKELSVWKCRLSTLRNHYFQDMKNVKTMDLSHNQISEIETRAFADLTNLEFLWLEYNWIEALDESFLRR